MWYLKLCTFDTICILVNSNNGYPPDYFILCCNVNHPLFRLHISVNGTQSKWSFTNIYENMLLNCNPRKLLKVYANKHVTKKLRNHSDPYLFTINK